MEDIDEKAWEIYVKINDLPPDVYADNVYYEAARKTQLFARIRLGIAVKLFFAAIKEEIWRRCQKSPLA